MSELAQRLRDKAICDCSECEDLLAAADIVEQHEALIEFDDAKWCVTHDSVWFAHKSRCNESLGAEVCIGHQIYMAETPRPEPGKDGWFVLGHTDTETP